MDMKEINDKKIARLFALSRDAALGLRQDTIVFANDAAQKLLGPGLSGMNIRTVLPDLPMGQGEGVSAVTIAGRLHSVTMAAMDDLMVITIPAAAPPAGSNSQALLQQLRQCVFSLRMTLDAAFPPDTPSEKASRYAPVLYHNHHSLVRLTGALADAAALADGSFSCLLRPMDLGQICADLVDSVNHMTAGQSARVEFRCARTTFPAMIDRDRMEQLLLQLLCNALQHTPSDGVVRMELTRQDSQLILRLDDTGTGISPARMADLFSGSGETDPTDLAPRGMGLGLHIAQGIVRAHGGSLILRSEEGQGTSIRMMIPAKDRLVLRDSAANDRGTYQLLTELSPVLTHQAYRKEYQD